jgi:hypothetical protein
MSTPVWSPGTLYQPGALVIPRSQPAPQTGTIANANFADGDTGWTLGSGFSIVAGTPFLPGSSYILKCVGAASTTVNTAQYAVAPGQLINGQCYGWVSTDNSNSMEVRIAFYDNTHTFLEWGVGGTVQGTGNHWIQMKVAAVAPDGAAFAAIGCAATSVGSNAVLFSNFTWDYTYAAPADALTYEAVQADAATSAATEPSWPLVAGEEVDDGGVVWEAVTFSQIVWTASPIMTSGGTEPTWPTLIGAAVADNTISWVATSRQITDPNCPNTTAVLIGSSKVFAVDDDIVDFCATTNPLDWTTQGDAGFLPTGLQQNGDNPNAALGLYRGNLVAFNSGGYQMWQIDPDPENMAILDAEPIGSTYSKAIQPVVNDLLFLTPLGVRSVGISGASANLQAGNVGNQIDDLVVAALKTLDAGPEPRGLYYPARGQYWLFFGAEAFVLTVYSVSSAQMTAYNTVTQSWSRYVFPAEITDWTLLGNDLYLRTQSGFVWKVDETALLDDVHQTDPNCLFLCHFDGANGSTDIIDETGFSIPVANGSMTYGDAAITTSTSQFGSGSLGTNVASGFYTPSAGQTALTPSVTVPIDADNNIFSGVNANWTIECWVNGSAAAFGSGVPMIAFDYGNSDASGTTGFFLRVGPSQTNLTSGVSGWASGHYNVSIPEATWHHVAVVSVAGEVTFYLDGVAQTNTSGGGTTLNWNTAGPVPAGFTIGYSPLWGGAGNTIGVGWIDEFRVSNIARYTANFTPPTQPFTDTGDGAFVGTPFSGIIQWPWLDMNSLGIEKDMIGFDLAMDGTCSAAVGYDQTNVANYTDEYIIAGDTLTGNPIPFPVRAPSFSLRLTFAANQAWEWEAANLYIQDDQGMR